MDSINRQQPENNRKDLNGGEAIKKMKEITDKNKTCYFCTHATDGVPMAVRPMSLQQLDESGNFWFLSSNDSHKNQEIQQDHAVHLLFQGSEHSDFLSVHGNASISHDKQKIKELWEPLAKVWFTEGKEDPRISVIKVTPIKGYYWDNKHGNAIAFVKMAAGALTGYTFDDSIEGEITL